MSEQQLEKEPHKEGPPWHNARVFSSFSEADVLRKSLLSDNTKQVKVKKQTNSQGEEVFVVKTRTDPALQKEEESSKKKENKKSKNKD